MSDDGTPTINYTVKEIVQRIDGKMDAQSQELQQIKEHVKITNGRVTALESEVEDLRKKDLMLWVQNHIPLFIIILVAFFTLVISDFRHPAVEAIVGLMALIG